MSKADIDLAHKTAAELSMYAKYIDQYGNARIAGAMRNAAALLLKMVEEAEKADV